MPDRASRRLQSETVTGPHGDTTVVVNLRIDEHGNFVLDGCDAGALPREIFDDYDYEYWVTIAATDTPRVLAVLGRPSSAGDADLLDAMANLLADTHTPSSDLMRFLDEHSIPYEFSTY